MDTIRPARCGMNWHFEVNRKPVGPIAEVDLVAKIHAGEVLPDCRVWNPTLMSWIRAGSSALASHFPAPPPPMPHADSPVPPASVPENLLHGVEQFTDKVVEDVRELLPQFLLPFREFRRFDQFPFPKCTKKSQYSDYEK